MIKNYLDGTLRLEVPTDEMVDTIKQLDEENISIIKIEDDRGGNGSWIFTIGKERKAL